MLEPNRRSIVLQNQGMQPVTISSFSSIRGVTSLADSLPITVSPMGSRALSVELQPLAAGPFLDTVIVTSDDPRHQLSRTVMGAVAREYFTTVDDRDSLAYVETGTWNFSNAHAYATTSRYAFPAANVSATFIARPKKAGLCDVQSIVPTTVNASPRARYLLSVNNVPADSVFLDQNTGSGAWVQLFQHPIPVAAEVKVNISDAQSSPISGRVLRTDAIRFQWVQDGPADVAGGPTRPTSFGLDQNYPNPFNPTTVVSYQLPVVSEVRLSVYDLLGREVTMLVNERKPAGTYTVRFDAGRLASGVYAYRMMAGSFVQTRKMLLLH